MSAKETTQPDLVNSPAHYKSASAMMEAIEVIEAFDLGFCDGNAVKYILRSGKKENHAEDLRKAIWYLVRLLRQEYSQEVTVEALGTVKYMDLDRKHQ